MGEAPEGMGAGEFCPNCGAAVEADSRFCGSCGADLTETSSSNEDVASPEPPVPGRIEQVTPGAADLAAQITTVIRTPAVVFTIGCAGASLVATLAFGFLLAALLPDKSQLSFGLDSYLDESLAQSVGLTLANFKFSTDFDGLAFRFTPALFALVPAGASALGAWYLGARQVSSLAPRAQVGYAMSAGPVFGALMAVVAIIVGSTVLRGEGESFEPSIAGAFLLGTLWCGLGAFVGTLWRLEPQQRREVFGRRAIAAGGLVWPGLRSLLLGLGLFAVVGTIAVGVQVFRNVGDIRESEDGNRSTALAIVDSSAYAVEHGAHFMDLTSGVEFNSPSFNEPIGLPLPVTKIDDLVGDGSELDSFEDLGDLPGFRIFDYERPLPVIAFILLVSLVAIPLILAVYAGFATARSARASSALPGLAWGATVGITWSLFMVLFNALVDKSIIGVGIYGTANGDSVFVMFLLGGGILGSIGGALAGAGGSDLHQAQDPAQ